MPQRHASKRRARRLVLASSLLAGFASVPARAELVVLTDGQFYKVMAYELVDEDRMQVTLAKGGGRITLPLARIERVVDDEVPYREPAPPAPPEAAPVAPAPVPQFDWRFAANQEVPSTPYGEMIFTVAKQKEVNPTLLAAVIWAESGFQAKALSPKGARGLMQLMPATAQRFGVERRELYTPQRNLHAGAAYLKLLLERYDPDIHLALAAYNAGEGSVDRYRGIPPYRETREYVKRIYRALGLEEPLVTAAAPPATAAAAPVATASAAGAR
jgi:soluble lytic murein transglycosylase-like protein